MSSRNRGFTIAGFFFVVFLVPLVAGNSCKDTGFHPEKKGKYFKRHFIDTLTTETASLCRIMCYLQEYCKSYNYQPSNGSCELSDSDVTENPYDLVLNPEHVYVSRKNPCENNPCPRLRVCNPNLINGSHSCPCSRGYEGPNCNEDINECETGKHDCPSDFECINTERSFACEKLFGGDNVSSGDLEISTILTNYGNSSYLDVLSGFLAPVLQNPSTSRWVKCWDAATDGWDVTKTFHPRCDGKGPTVTIVRVGSYVFGGYTEISWHSKYYKQRFLASQSFLFSLFNTHGYDPINLRLLNKISWIPFGKKSSGPSFGLDLLVSQNRYAYTRCYSYQCPPGCSVRINYCPFFTGKRNWFLVNDVEVFFRQVKA